METKETIKEKLEELRLARVKLETAFIKVKIKYTDADIELLKAMNELVKTQLNE